MTVPTSYPGVYIQELPSLVHAVQPAPTSIAVFVGYTHPFLTKQWGVAVPLFSFADYQTNFGGFFSSPWQPDYVGQAVFQFFQNGGPMCYVVGLQAQKYYTGQDAVYVGGTSKGAVTAATVALPPTGTAVITFTALQPVGVAATTPATGTLGVPMTVAISNLQQTAGTVGDTADIVISYGSTVETYRKVVITSLAATLANSSLVSASRRVGHEEVPVSLGLAVLLRVRDRAADARSRYNVINPPDFAAVFADYEPLDKVPVFNLLAIPGIAATQRHVRGRRLLRAQAGLLHHGHTVARGSELGRQCAGHRPRDRRVSVAGAASQHQRRGLLPVAADHRPHHRRADLRPAERVRGRHLRPRGQHARGVEVAGRDRDGAYRDDRRRSGRGHDRPAARDPELKRRQLPAQLPRPRYRRVRRAHHGRRRHEHRAAAVAVRAGAAHGAVHRADACTPASPGRSSSRTPRRCGPRSPRRSGAFMLSLFRQGAFAGTTPSQAFLVQCDATTTTQTDIANGVVNILVGFAPLIPAEFVDHPDRAARRPGTQPSSKGARHGQPDLPGQPEPLRPVQDVPVPRLLRHAAPRPVAAVSKVSALKRSSDVIEYKEGGNAIILKGLGRTKYEPITLERGVTQDKDFITWANYAQLLDHGLADHLAGQPAPGDQRSSCSTRRRSRCCSTSSTAAGCRSSRRSPTSTPAPTPSPSSTSSWRTRAGSRTPRPPSCRRHKPCRPRRCR